MSIGTVKIHVKAVLDTNVLISAIGFGGKPREVFLLLFEENITFVTSLILLAELHEVINKKFPRFVSQLSGVRQIIEKKFYIVQPLKSLHILEDEDDNRVLEAAVEAHADYIVTGDSDLLRLKTFRKIVIVAPDQFVKEITSRL